MMKVALFVALVACAYAAPATKEELKQEPGPAPHNAGKVYHALGHKQLYVNKAAEHHGAGTGTAYYEGVPGTGVRGDHHGYGYAGHHDGYGYGHDGHHGNYAYDGYGFDGHHGAAPYAGSHHKGAYYNYGPHNDHFYGRGYGYNAGHKAGHY